MKTLNPLDLLTDDQLIGIMHSLEHQRMDKRLKGKVEIVEQDLEIIYLKIVKRMGGDYNNQKKVGLQGQ